MVAKRLEISLPLKKFNIRRQMKLETKSVIIGKPYTGKTVLMFDIAMNLRDKFPVVNIFNGSELEKHTYQGIVPETAISSSFDQSRLERIVQRQRLLTNRNHEDPMALTIIDDCGDDEKFFKSNLMSKIFKLGRHQNHMITFLFQDVLDMPRKQRSMIDYVFIFRITENKARKLAWENYASFLTYKQFCQVLDACTEDHGCLVLAKFDSDNNRPDGLYFWYKAKVYNKRDIKLGSEQFWKECTNHCNENYDEEEDIMGK